MKVHRAGSPILLLLLFGMVNCSLSLKAQQAIRGIVLDSQTGEPVDVANVLLFEGSRREPVKFVLTNSAGSFSLHPGTRTDSLEIQVSLLGYAPLRQTVRPGQFVRFDLQQQPFALKEVEIRPGRVWGQRDTLHYDVDRFLSPKDEAIKDVLKKMPGIDVDEAGKISYNGKNISKFYVEGMDLTNGRYSQMNNNLPAKAVKEVQILENHQPVRALQKKINTEQVALNLKLKPEFRDRWLGNLEGGGGGSPLLWEGEGEALQINRKSQSAYLYKGNNHGKDVTAEQAILTSGSFENRNGPAVPSFLSQPSFAVPLDKERLLFNEVHTLSANRLYKLNETTQLRMNANYIHDLRNQDRGNETRYYQAADTVSLTEQCHNRIRTDRAEVSLELENNAENHFLTNHFDLIGKRETGVSDYTGNAPVSQRIETPDLGIRNYLQNLWVRDAYTFDIHSLVRYHNRNSRLQVNGDKQKIDLQQLYIDHSFSLIKKNGRISRRYTGGITGNLNTIRNGMQVYFRPDYQYTAGKWKTTLAIPFTWTLFPKSGFSRLAPNLSLFLQYKLNYAWRFSGFASYSESYGDPICFYPESYRTDYRTRMQTNGFLPVYRQQNYSLEGEYKNTVNEFFATLSLTYNPGWSNQTYEQAVDKKEVLYTAHLLANRTYGWTIGGTVAKGFFDWGLKTSLSYRLGRNKGTRLSQGEKQNYRSDYMEYEPKISWSPFRKFAASYQAAIRYGGSKIGTRTHLHPLLNVVQKLGVSYEVRPVEIDLSLDHYHNDVTGTKVIDAFFADLSLRWKTRKWQFTAEATNLFNKKEYRYTRYSSTESYTSWIRIRPREFMARVKYKF